MKKKAQIQIFETIAVVVVFLILVAIGFIFYGKFINRNLEAISEESAQAKSVAIAQRIMFMPELQCSKENIIEENCIDKLKMDSAKNAMAANKIYYYDLFEFSDIKVKQSYPVDDSWYLYSNPITTNDYRSKFTTNVPISIYDPKTKLYGFGIMTIETFTR